MGVIPGAIDLGVYPRSEPKVRVGYSRVDGASPGSHNHQPEFMDPACGLCPRPGMMAAVAFRERVMSLVSMTATVEQAVVEQAAPKGARCGCGPYSACCCRFLSRCSGKSPCAWGCSNGRLVPPPSVIFNTFADLARTGELQSHALATIWRVAAGFVLGVAAGTVFGAIAGYSALTHRLVDPTLQALRAIPSIAWVPLFILWFGIFEASKIILIAVGVFFPVYLGVMGAVLSVDRKIVEVAVPFASPASPWFGASYCRR